MFGYARRAYANCTGAGSTLTCTGDLTGTDVVSGGINVNAAVYDTLNVNNLNAAITPNFGFYGIDFKSTVGNVTITSDAAIQTTGSGSGIYGASSAAGALVTITNTGDISTSSTFQSFTIEGFALSAGGDVTVTNSGNLSGGNFRVGASDVAQLTNNGSVSATRADTDAIFVGTVGGGIALKSSGDVTATRDAIGVAAPSGGNIAVTLYSGTVYGTRYGVRVQYGVGASTITNAATLSGGTAAIHAIAGDETVNNTGTITGTVDLGAGTNAVTNATGATITGNLTTGTGNDTVTNSGTFSGNLSLGDGVNAVTNAAGATITGNLTTGTGNDTFANYGTFTGTADLGAGTNVVTNTSHNSFTGDLTGGAGDDTVTNSGTFTGNVDLGGGTNAFNNLSGGIFNSGATVDLGAGNTLTNAGTLSPGGTGTVQTTALTGNLVQTGSGNLAVDISGTNADRVTVSGTVDLAGTVVPNLLSLPTARSFTLLTSTGTTTDSGITVNDTGAIDYELDVQANTTKLLLTVSFASSGANPNQTAIGNSLTAAFNAGGGALSSFLLSLANLPTSSALANALDQLSPGVTSDGQIAALYASLGFANSLLSCKVNGTTTASIIHEGQCLWAGANATFLDQGTTSGQPGFNETTGSFAGGVQFALDDVWRLGFGAGYQQSSLSTATNASSEGEQAQGGVALKYNAGPLLLAGMVSGGRGWYDAKRPIAFTGFSGTATSNSEIDFLNGGVRLAYVFGTRSFTSSPPWMRARHGSTSAASPRPAAGRPTSPWQEPSAPSIRSPPRWRWAPSGGGRTARWCARSCAPAPPGTRTATLP